MPPLSQHPILQQSFAIIDQEMGNSLLPPDEYAVVRRVIHSTADFEYAQLLQFSPNAIARGIQALQLGCPIVVDVGMVKQGCQGMISRTFQNPLVAAVELAESASSHQTRTAMGLLKAWEQFPQAIYAIGNAPTALAALSDRLATTTLHPPLVIGVPVGFVGVLEAKQRLAQLTVPSIRTTGRKGGSTVAAAIINALLVLAWEAQP